MKLVYQLNAIFGPNGAPLWMPLAPFASSTVTLAASSKEGILIAENRGISILKRNGKREKDGRVGEQGEKHCLLPNTSWGNKGIRRNC
jgi:hypothetical protein